MSTRYVYEKKNVEAKLNTYGGITSTSQESKQSSYWFCTGYELKLDRYRTSSGYSYVWNFYPTGSLLVGQGIAIWQSTSSYPYIVLQGYYGEDVPRTSKLISSGPGYWWKTTNDYQGNTYYIGRVEKYAQKDGTTPTTLSYQIAGIEKGDETKGYQTSSTKTLTEGVNGTGDDAYWLEYLTSDTIDPAAVSYSTSRPS